MSSAANATKVAIITGCSSGVGRALALLLAKTKPSYQVYATMRSPDSPKGVSLVEAAAEANLPNLHVRALDVTKDESVASLVDGVVGEHGRVDVVVNNAGYAVNGTHEMLTIEKAQQQFDTNLFGVMRLDNRVLPVMRKQGSGHIIAVSSVGGTSGVPFNDVYCSSKFALEGLYESLAATNGKLGIGTSLVEPGAIKTDFVSNGDLPSEEDVPDTLKPVFQKYKAAMLAMFKQSTAQTGEEVAEVIVRVIEDGERGEASVRYQTSEWAKAYVGGKFKDTSGNSARDLVMARFFPDAPSDAAASSE
eukprot:TRINITY_DN23064_c0_g1_i1.p1 TRINITY_DN23064_c0_g1~~TRINITY_DN23064_c0_g1_i1.p1  ORF type:complete len:318 (-),score=123.01 TRINITY_DN23064_c0_g1_i1:61-975(-)